MGPFPAGIWFTLGLDQLHFKLDQFCIVSSEMDKVVVEVRDHAEGSSYNTAFDNNYLYTIHGSGLMTIEHTVTPQGVMPAWLPKIGLQWIIVSSLNNVTWYGRGPFETYPDRKTGAKIGVYNKSVQEMEESYLVPQDYGCRTDNRWVKLESAEGIGLQFSGNELFNFNAQQHGTDNLSRARYPYQVKRTDATAFNVDYATSGVGCTAISVLDKYRVLPREYHFTLHVKPYKK
jgi:beta-galactosidase